MNLKTLSILSLCLLTACAPPKPASQAPLNEPMPVEKREQQTATFTSWVIDGAMSAKSPNKSWTASVNWKQQGAGEYQIRLFGPLGGGTVMIEKKAGVITYRDGPKTVSSKSADQLLLQETGIQLPVSHLYYWVRGLPAPGSVQATDYDQYNHLTMLKQSGYTIRYLNYTSKGSYDLPSKIQLTGHGISMKFIIKSWSV